MLAGITLALNAVPKIECPCNEREGSFAVAEPAFEFEDTVSVEGAGLAQGQQQRQGNDAANLSRQVQDGRIQEVQTVRAGNQPPNQFNDQYDDIRAQQRKELREMARDRWNNFYDLGKSAVGATMAYRFGPNLAPTVPPGVADRASELIRARRTGIGRAIGPLAAGWVAGYAADKLLFSKDQTMEFTIAGDIAGLGIAFTPFNWRVKAAAILGSHLLGKTIDHFRQPVYVDHPRMERHQLNQKREEEARRAAEKERAREQARQGGKAGQENVGPPQPIQQGDGQQRVPVEPGRRQQPMRPVDPRQEAIDEAHRKANRERQEKNIANHGGSPVGGAAADTTNIPPWQNPYLKQVGVQLPDTSGATRVESLPGNTAVAPAEAPQAGGSSKFSQHRQRTYAPQ